jgi:hypothetical protein
MISSESLLAQGIAAAKAGDKSTARRLLSQVARRNPGSEAAWLWLSSVLDTPQGREHCLRRVLAVNPDNHAAQRGLAAVGGISPAPALVTQPAASAMVQQIRAQLSPAMDEGVGRRFSARDIVHQTWFWQAVVSFLAIIAFGLIAILAYATLNGASAAGDETLMAMVPTLTPWPRGTLRPTFTPTPTKTPTPTDTPTPTPTFTPTPMPTFTPTDTPVPTEPPAATPKPRVRSSSPTLTPTPRPAAKPALPPRSLDPRLASLGVRVEPALVGPGKPYWRLVEARWANEREAGGKHTIYVEVYDAGGNRAVGRPVIVQWSEGSVVLPVENPPSPDWSVNFPMYSTLGSYAVSMGGAPSDRVVGLGMGTADAPDFTVHTCFYLTFRLAQR